MGRTTQIACDATPCHCGRGRTLPGTSVVRSCIKTDLRTISDAYSHDCDARPMRCERVSTDATHSAMDVCEPTSVNAVQNPSGEGCADVAVQTRHRTVFDAAQPPGAHDELISLAKLCHERAKFTEVIRTVGIAHHDVASANVGARIDICPPEPPFGCAEHSGPSRQCEFRSSIVRTVNDQDFTTYTRIAKTLLAPRDKFRDGEFLVDRGNDDRYFGISNVVFRNEKLDSGIVMTVTTIVMAPLAH